LTEAATPAPEPFSDQLEAWLTSDDPKSVGHLGVVFGEKSFAVTILFLMVFPALPLPTGGVTHVFEVITVLLGVEMVIGMRTIWLPARFRDRGLGAATTEKVLPFMMKRVRWLERFSKPRAARLFSQRWFVRILGVVFIGFALGAGLAPPFSGLDTLPAMGAVLVALSMIVGDVLALIVGAVIGAVIGVAGIALSITVGAVLVHLVRSLF